MYNNRKQSFQSLEHDIGFLPISILYLKDKSKKFMETSKLTKIMVAGYSVNILNGI